MFLTFAGSLFATGALARMARAAESEIALSTPTGTIHGTLVLPSKLPAPVVLIIAGSGPTDRNGNNGPIYAETYKLLAAALAAQGIASVSYDKRGIGASGPAAPSEKELRFQNYVDDAAAWLRLLRADSRFTKIEVAGHSEGSLIGMIAVQRAPADAFVSLEGAGRPAQDVIREQLKPALSPELYAQAGSILSQLQQGHAVANPPAQLDALFRPSVQPYLISWFAYDPAVEIAKVRVPVTIVQGTADIQVTMTDANDLKRGAPSARLVVVEGMNHVLEIRLRTGPHRRRSSKATKYSLLPIDPHAVAAVAAFAT